MSDFGVGRNFLDVTAISQSFLKKKKKKGGKLGFIKIKNFCSWEDIIKKEKRQATDGKICKSYTW